jgi:selenocysteine-specific translation elongation factor
MSDELVGTVIEYFAKPLVAGVELSGAIKVGDKIKIKGHTTSLEFAVNSMQKDNSFIEEAGAGDSIGIKVPDRVRQGDQVYKVTD